MNNDYVKHLEDMIQLYSNKYYSGETTLDDYEFDNLLESLRKVDPNNKLLSKTGFGFEATSNKIKHPYVELKSLPKVRVSASDIISNYKLITPKFDGANVEVIYKYGEFYKAISRGNGVHGIDISDKLSYILPSKLNLLEASPEIKDFVRYSIISISGEFLLSKESKNKYYKDEVAYRNIPAGFLNRKSFDNIECKRFSFVPYRINAVDSTKKVNDSLLSDLNCRYKIQKLLNFLFKENVPYNLPDDNKNSYNDIINTFNDYGFFYDGIVLNNEVSVNKRIDNDRYLYIISYNEIAYKINTDYKDVKLSNISWNLTRTGKLVPVANFERVLLSGAYISRATLHNARVVEYNEIKEGTTLRVIRSGEVIPHVIGIVKEDGKLVQIR